MDECHPKILLVDDNSAFYRLIIEEAKLQEFECLEEKIIYLPDSTVALETYIDENPCIVILDVRMPLLSGVEIAKQIHNYDPDANIFLLTIHPQDSEAIKAVEDHLVYGIIPKDSGHGVVAALMCFMLNYIKRIESLA